MTVSTRSATGSDIAVARVREEGADYLAYSLIDSVIDSYFPAVDRYGEVMEELHGNISAASGAHLRTLHGVQSDLRMLRRTIRPLRDELARLLPEGEGLVQGETRVFLRDCHDHTMQLIDLVDTYREMCSDLRDYYISTANQRMNEVMKVLTIISTIFIPLSFIAAVYGMNFNTTLPGNMPELNQPYGYVVTLLAMGASAIGLLYYVWHKGWLSRDDSFTP